MRCYGISDSLLALVGKPRTIVDVAADCMSVGSLPCCNLHVWYSCEFHHDALSGRATMPSLPAAALFMHLSVSCSLLFMLSIHTFKSMPVLTQPNPIHRSPASRIHTHHTAITHLEAGVVYGSIEYRRLEHNPVCFNTSIHLSSPSARSPYFQPSFGLPSMEEKRSRQKWINVRREKQQKCTQKGPERQILMYVHVV